MAEKTSPEQLIGLTARWTAGVRARESARADRLFEDPWAKALVGKEGAEWLAQRPGENTLPMAIRTRFFDGFLQDVSPQYAIRQVGLMAAGLDTAAFWVDRAAGARLPPAAMEPAAERRDDLAGRSRAAAPPPCRNGARR